MYTPEIAQQIIEVGLERGWNFYKTSRITGLSPDETIRQSLADILEVNIPYTSLPVAEDPRDPQQVHAALEALSQKLHRELPTIMIGDESLPLTGITLSETYVKIHNPEGTIVNYPTFLRAVKTLTLTK